MCIMESKSKLIHRPGIKGNESILNEGFESLPTEYSAAVQSAQSEAAGALRLVKGEGKETYKHPQWPASGRAVALFLLGPSWLFCLRARNSKSNTMRKP